MSLLSRLLGKSPPSPETPATDATELPVEPPAPDPAARAREEEADLERSLAAGDMAAVGKWVLEGSSTAIRQRAAQAITDLDQLHELIRATRHGNDKNVYRILAARRDDTLASMRAAQKLTEDLEATAAAIARHSSRPYDASYEITLGQLEQRWRELAPHATPELQQQAAQQLEQAHGVIENHRQAQQAEAERQQAAALAAAQARRQRELEAQAEAAAASEAARQREAARQAERERQQADEAERRRLVGLLRQAQAALQHGGTARAARLREAIAEKLPEAPALPAWFERQLQQLDQRIDELKDWKTFRVAPKRAELLQQMQALVGADLSPEDLAKRIRRLREEWRSLNRGAGEDTSPESEQFQQAAELAYQPCREHFARQAELRRENQAQREALIERLAALATEQAVENPDWRAMQHALATARREWRQWAPVDQSVVKALQQRFHVLANELQARLDAEYERNVQLRRELISRASELVGLEDTRQAIEEAKRLQRAWKTVGIIPRKRDNSLWEEFRRHCDAIFQRSAQESAQQAAALDAGVARATSLCEELERIAGSGNDDAASDAKRLDELGSEFRSLDLPRASARELRQRFSRASDRCAEALAKQRAAAERKGWSELLAAATRLNAYALATIDGASAADVETLRDAASAALAGLLRAPKDGRELLEQRMAAIAEGGEAADLAANEATMRLLCVRAELAAGLATPPQDLELRREYQMQRLVESMGRGERISPAELDDLALEWVAVGPVEAAVHGALLARLERCLDARGS
ncbi:MAG TPA: DUF349 domain-containing protein [Steroidobacteraceae bacterium]|nr:DUF349 domain-containing protein [Steroidobacteraceae bacterium]